MTVVYIVLTAYSVAGLLVALVTFKKHGKILRPTFTALAYLVFIGTVSKNIQKAFDFGNPTTTDPKIVLLVIGVLFTSFYLIQLAKALQEAKIRRC